MGSQIAQALRGQAALRGAMHYTCKVRAETSACELLACGVPHWDPRLA